jgi:hypothetical protein
MLCKDCVNLFKAEIDFIEPLAEGFNLSGMLLQLISINHRLQTSQHLGVEEGGGDFTLPLQ